MTGKLMKRPSALCRCCQYAKRPHKGGTYKVPVKDVGERIAENHPLVTVDQRRERVLVGLTRSKLGSTGNNLKQ